MARKKARRSTRRPAGVKANGTLKKGYRFKKGGGTVKARKR